MKFDALESDRKRKQAVKEIMSLIEEHLDTLPEEEQVSRLKDALEVPVEAGYDGLPLPPVALMRKKMKFDGIYFNFKFRDWIFGLDPLPCGCFIFGIGPMHLQFRHPNGCYRFSKWQEDQDDDDQRDI